jgi:hypothetical protein
VLYDLDFLKHGRDFPPREEIRRLEAYRVNDMLLDDEPWEALPEYKRRVLYILSNFALDQKTAYLYNANYWSELAEKTKELIFGDPPAIATATEENAETLKRVLRETRLLGKAKEGVGDFVAFGDWVTKLVEKDGNTTFINVDPATWFPVVSREDVKEIKYHVFAWTVKAPADRYELHVQIHEKGKYKNLAFAVTSYNPNAYYTVKSTGQNIVVPTYTLGKELKEACDGFVLGEWNTGLDDFAVVSSANNPVGRRTCGTSDFDKITDACMEYNVRMTLKNVVLDKHSAPVMYGPQLDGDDNTDAGNYIECPTGSSPPGYLTWDANMTAAETTIGALKADVSNLSGMGTLLDNKTFGESQGYDALMIKLAPALMKSTDKKAAFGEHIKKLVSLLSGKYGSKISPDELTITWHDGIPKTESVRADVAKKHLETGWSTFDVLTKDYGWSDEEAELAIERKRLETPAMPMFGAEEGDEPIE